MNRALHDSLFELYMQGGLELFQAGTRGLKRELIIDLETTALTPERGEILRLYARDLTDPSSTFDQLVKPKRPISKLVQQITGISNEMVREAPPLEAVLPEFLDFLDDATLVSSAIGFDLSFLKDAIKGYG